MDSQKIFKLLSLVGLALGGVGTLLTGWADDKKQSAIITQKINEAFAARGSKRS